MPRHSSIVDKLPRTLNFPAIAWYDSSQAALSLSLSQRVVLLSYDKETNRISFRHYSILAQPCGVSKSVKALVGRRQLPNLGNLQDVSDYLTKSGYGSVSHLLDPHSAALSDTINTFHLQEASQEGNGKLRAISHVFLR